ncbi:hypothetical protein [Schumannella sp. 10F1B-5-1]|uniref:hypothetical protein n=1 Tax=Schumannella sp. 10F1B-5-1 TaxID=2590780 RepID=UPI00113086A0|nr:hypothetical protein [Schumannella sp. 10F1B-5-1]TPW76698.1 hypothetical protein FJ658_01775 [Schumannella sp. 10F1B-5-1]
MTDAPAPEPADPGEWVDADTRRWTMPRDFPERSRRDLVWLSRRRPEVVRPSAALLLAVVVLAAAAGALGAVTIAWSLLGIGVLVALGLAASVSSTPRDFDPFAGSTYLLRFTPTSIVITAPGSTLELDVAGLTRARTHGEVAELVTTVPRVAPVVPAPLLAGGALARLRAAIEHGGDATAAPAEPYPVTHPLDGLPSAFPVASTPPGGRGGAYAAGRAALRFATSPAPLVIAGVAALLLVLQIATGSRLLGDWALPYVIFFAVALAGAAGAAAVVGHRMRRTGLVTSVQLQSDRLAIRTGPIARTIPLAFITAVQRGDGVVLVRSRPHGEWRSLPAELFPPEVLAALVLRVEGQQGRAAGPGAGRVE